jgi:SAM-dependent methyltransferase
MTSYQGDFARAARALAAPGADLTSELAAIEKLCTQFDVREARMQWFEEVRLAIDVRELFGRLSALLTGSGAAAVDPALDVRSRALRSGLAHLHRGLAEKALSVHACERARLRGGGLRGAELLSWLATYPAMLRDLAFEDLVGIAHPPMGTANLQSELIDYVPGGIASIVRCVLAGPVTADDEFLDVGAGVGKALLAVKLLSGARVRGIEIQPDLCRQARSAAADLGLESFSVVEGDACDVDLGEPSVIFIYLPFTGRVLARMVERLRALAARKEMMLGTLGFDLPYDWLVPRRATDFWLTIYDSKVLGAEPRAPRQPVPIGPVAEQIVNES